MIDAAPAVAALGAAVVVALRPLRPLLHPQQQQLPPNWFFSSMAQQWRANETPANQEMMWEKNGEKKFAPPTALLQRSSSYQPSTGQTGLAAVQEIWRAEVEWDGPLSAGWLVGWLALIGLLVGIGGLCCVAATERPVCLPACLPGACSAASVPMLLWVAVLVGNSPTAAEQATGRGARKIEGERARARIGNWR